MPETKRIAFGKNTKVAKLYMKGLETFPGKTVGMVLDTDSCLQLAENLIRAARARSGGQAIDLTLFTRKKTPVLTVTAAGAKALRA